MKRKPVNVLLLTVLTCAISLVSCAPARTSSVPEQTDDGWQTASLNEVGISEEQIDQVVARIHDGTYQNGHSILIIKDDKLVFEEYFDGYVFDYNGDQYRGAFTEFGIDTTHNLASVTKSVTSALLGVAIDQGLIEGVVERVFTFFPEYASLNDEEKNAITLYQNRPFFSNLDYPSRLSCR